VDHPHGGGNHQHLGMAGTRSRGAPPGQKGECQQQAEQGWRQAQGAGPAAHGSSHALAPTQHNTPSPLLPCSWSHCCKAHWQGARQSRRPPRWCVAGQQRRASLPLLPASPHAHTLSQPLLLPLQHKRCLYKGAGAGVYYCCSAFAPLYTCYIYLPAALPHFSSAPPGLTPSCTWPRPPPLPGLGSVRWATC
jgi:hypothetical protein